MNNKWSAQWDSHKHRSHREPLELGPPDLYHVVKSMGKSGQHDLGSYHFVSGVDASSSASLAAYINSLTYGIEDLKTWFSKTPVWKVRNGCYCCFNAFSRVDFRVDVKTPGGVVAYVVDLRGERHDATPEMWQETYLSALLRAILYSDDPAHALDAYRKLDPITTAEGELRFLAAAEACFSKVASVTTNHLTAGLLKYFGASGRYQQVANLFEKISVHEEVKALQIMSSPSSYTLLHAQCDFLREKGRHLPFHRSICEILPERVKTDDDEIPRLPAPGLRGTWARAYALLTKLVAQIGWDELLKTRSCVFYTANIDPAALPRLPDPAYNPAHDAQTNRRYSATCAPPNSQPPPLNAPIRLRRPTSSRQRDPRAAASSRFRAPTPHSQPQTCRPTQSPRKSIARSNFAASALQTVKPASKER
ncbi:Chs5p-Arf1p-binding proteins-domain-containing protein [Favolaschia claudopus]|uniref:Chs5p-Arf1p-binding proteins-domain-containing protein n=1 Tax=Favolaschia claudopus TaxID=2862362 RepID=A0AAW0D0S8_9AGAR